MLISSFEKVVTFTLFTIIITYFEISVAAFSLMIKNCFYIYRLNYGNFLFERICLLDVIFPASYKGFDAVVVAQNA